MVAEPESRHKYNYIIWLSSSDVTFQYFSNVLQQGNPQDIGLFQSQMKVEMFQFIISHQDKFLKKKSFTHAWMMKLGSHNKIVPDLQHSSVRLKPTFFAASLRLFQLRFSWPWGRPLFSSLQAWGHLMSNGTRLSRVTSGQKIRLKHGETAHISAHISVNII